MRSYLSMRNWVIDKLAQKLINTKTSRFVMNREVFSVLSLNYLDFLNTIAVLEGR